MNRPNWIKHRHEEMMKLIENHIESTRAPNSGGKWSRKKKHTHNDEEQMSCGKISTRRKNLKYTLFACFISCRLFSGIYFVFVCRCNGVMAANWKCTDRRIEKLTAKKGEAKMLKHKKIWRKMWSASEGVARGKTQRMRLAHCATWSEPHESERGRETEEFYETYWIDETEWSYFWTDTQHH